MSETKNDLPIQLFASAAEWHKWLEAHADAAGIWLRVYKKGRGKSVSYAEALDEALCFGWIDSQAATYDDDSFLRKFTPRRKSSLWSKRNIEHVERLTKEGRMKPGGLAEVEAAKADGRWQRAYDAQTGMTIPPDFLKELDGHPVALEFFGTLNKTNLFAIAWRLQTAKTDATRQRRMSVILEKLNKREKLH